MIGEAVPTIPMFVKGWVHLIHFLYLIPWLPTQKTFIFFPAHLDGVIINARQMMPYISVPVSLSVFTILCFFF